MHALNLTTAQKMTAAFISVVMELVFLLLLFLGKPDPPLDFYDMMLVAPQLPGIAIPLLAKNELSVFGIVAVQVILYYNLLLKLINLWERPSY